MDVKSSLFQITILVTLLLCIGNYTYAFKPDIAPSGEIFSKPWHAKKYEHGHAGITKFSLKEIPAITFGEDKLKFSDHALEQIIEANKSIDEGDSSKSSKYHCDNEELNACSSLILGNKIEIIGLLKLSSPDGTNARKVFGETLHTIQDFYAHSTWVNLKSGIAALGKSKIADPDKDTSFGHWSASQTCKWTGLSPLPTNELKGIGLTHVTSGYFHYGTIGFMDPPGYKCDHGIIPYEYWRGINKDHDEQNNFDKAFLIAKQATKDFTNQIIEADSIKGNEDAIRAFLDAEAASALLGFVVDTTGSMGSTVTGVKNAITTIVNDIKSDPKKDVSEFLVMSYGDPGIGNISVAHDADTMLSYVNNIQVGVPDGGGDCPERSTAALRKAIQKASKGSILYLYTDADTQEASLASNIISEAKSKNIKVNFFVSSERNCSGGSEIDGTYSSIAPATGGQVVKYEHTIAGAEGTVGSIKLVFGGKLHSGKEISGETTATTGSSRSRARSLDKTPGLNIVSNTSSDGHSANHFMPVVLSKTDHSVRSLRAATATDEHQHPIKVDSSVEAMVISIAMAPLGEIKLFRPDGTEAVNTDADIEITSSSVNQFITIDSPIAGEWKLTISSVYATKYNISVKMETDISFVNFSFVEEKGRPGHTGLFPIDGQPLISGTQYILTTFSGEVKDVELVLVSLAGKELKKIELFALDSTNNLTTYAGTITLVSEYFRIRAQGTDKSGNAFERVYPIVYKAQSVSVTRSPSQNRMVPGELFKARFFVKNTGLKDTFTLAASDTSGYIQSVNPTEITLGKDESKEVEVLMNIDAAASIDSLVTVTLTATSKTNPISKNTASIDFTVEGDTDKDGIPDAVEKGDSGNFDGNGDGTPDYQQNKVTSMLAHGSNIFITLEIIGNGELSAVKAIPSPSISNEPNGFLFLLNMFDFKIKGLANGEETKLKIYYGNHLKKQPTKYYKYGPTTALSEPHWYDFSSAVFEEGTVILTLKDGEDGDDDLTANGIITDAGGLGFPNNVPVAINDTASTNINTSVVINVIANDKDPDGDTLSIVSFDGISTQGGRVENNGNGSLTYHPPASFFGSDSFTYTISDNFGASMIATVTVSSHPTVPTLSQWAMIILSIIIMLIGFFYLRQSNNLS